MPANEVSCTKQQGRGWDLSCGGALKVATLTSAAYRVFLIFGSSDI
ncbi:hypothetical protein ALAU109921_18650 [Alteromonas australica]